MSERKVGIVLNYVSLSLSAVVGLLYVPILLHYIGKNEYGLYQLIGSLIAYFSVMDFGISGAVVRFYSKAKALADSVMMENILGMAVRAYVVIAGLIAGVGSYVYFHLDWVFGNSLSASEITTAKTLFIFLIINASATLVATPFRAVMTSYERFLVLKSIDIVQLILQPTLILFFLRDYPSAVTVAVVQTVLNFIGIGCRGYYTFVRLKARFHLHYYDAVLVSGFCSLAVSLFFEAIIDQIFFRTNQVVLGIVSGAAAVAVYAIASVIYITYMQLSTAISGVYVPHVTTLIAKNSPVTELNALFFSIGRWQSYLLGFILSAFFLVGKVFIDRWAGPGFEEAYIVALVLITPFTIDLIQNLGLSILQGYNKYGFRAKVMWGVGIGNLIVIVPLATKWGALGCAFGTGLCWLICSGLLMNWYYYKKIGLDIPGFWREIGRIFGSVLLSGAVGWGVLRFIIISSMLGIVAFCAVYFVIYGVIAWCTSMKENEKDIIRRAVGRFRIE